MRIHILGIGGTFMAGLALLARELGHTVSGSDKGVLYPPMSEQLAQHQISVHAGYKPEHLNPVPDLVVIGNAVSRGNAAAEYVLNTGIPFCSGPEWLARYVLPSRWVLAVAGTHGKTTTSSMLAWILESVGLKPGFLIGGIPKNFAVSARMGDSPYFVIEADEYDTAFFDKRSKFVHYHPRTLVLNNLEFDHADIFPDLAAITRQFHHLIRTVPGNGQILYNEDSTNLELLLEKGYWTPALAFSTGEHAEGAHWSATLQAQDGSCFTVFEQGDACATVTWPLLGTHNVSNALAAIAAAKHVNVKPSQAAAALTQFTNVSRRLERKGEVAGITVFDDFAHHPTAIASTLQGLRANVGEQARILVALELGSYTMRTGWHGAALYQSLQLADWVGVLQPATEEGWDFDAWLEQAPIALEGQASADHLVARLVAYARAGDTIVLMSNGSFDNLSARLLPALQAHAALA